MKDKTPDALIQDLKALMQSHGVRSLSYTRDDDGLHAFLRNGERWSLGWLDIEEQPDPAGVAVAALPEAATDLIVERILSGMRQYDVFKTALTWFPEKTIRQRIYLWIIGVPGVEQPRPTGKVHVPGVGDFPAAYVAQHAPDCMTVHERIAARVEKALDDKELVGPAKHFKAEQPVIQVAVLRQLINYEKTRPLP